MKRLDFINKSLPEKPLPPEPELSDFYHPSEAQKNGELLFVAVGTGIATYALYNYLK